MILVTQSWEIEEAVLLTIDVDAGLETVEWVGASIVSSTRHDDVLCTVTLKNICRLKLKNICVKFLSHLFIISQFVLHKLLLTVLSSFQKMITKYSIISTPTKNPPHSLVEEYKN